MKKILIIGPSWIGDMVMSQSLYRELKKQHPDSTIDVLAPAWCKPLLSKMSEVKKAIEMPLGHGELKLISRYKLGRELRKEKYSQAYILPNSFKSAIIPLIAQIPIRTGWKGEARFGLLNDIRMNKQSFTYMVERYVALAHPKKDMQNSSSLGGLTNISWPKLTLNDSLISKTIEKFSLSINKPIIGLCPGAEFGPAKKWPVQHYSELANQLLNDGYQVWLFGSQKDQNTTSSIFSSQKANSHLDIVDLAGKTSLEEAIDLLPLCKYVVSNDSGLMHIAAAVGCHVIGIYGSTSPHYTPPLTDKVDIVNTDIECRPCFQRECPLQHLKCLNNITPEMIKRLIRDS